MKRQDQPSIFKHNKKKNRSQLAPSLLNTKETIRNSPKSNKNGKSVSILNLRTQPLNDEQQALYLKQYKAKLKNYKKQYQEIIEQLEAKNSKIEHLVQFIQKLQSQLQAMKKEQSDYQQQILSFQQQQLSFKNLEIQHEERDLKILSAKPFQLLQQITTLVDQQIDFKDKLAFTNLVKEMHTSLILISKNVHKQSGELDLLQNKNENKNIETDLKIKNLQTQNQEIAQKLSESQHQHHLITSQYKESLELMKGRVQSMRAKILQLEIKNQQDLSQLQIQLSNAQQEKQNLSDINQQLKLKVQEQQFQVKQQQEQIKLFQIKDEEYKKSIIRLNEQRQINNIQNKNNDLYNSKEIDLKGEISKLDYDIQRLQMHLQQALNENSNTTLIQQNILYLSILSSNFAKAYQANPNISALMKIKDSQSNQFDYKCQIQVIQI